MKAERKKKSGQIKSEAEKGSSQYSAFKKQIKSEER